MRVSSSDPNSNGAQHRYELSLNYRRFGSRRYVCCAVAGTNAVIVVGGVEDDEVVEGKGVENTQEIMVFIAPVQGRYPEACITYP